MSDTVYLRGAELRVLKTIIPKEGSPFLRAHFRSDLTREVSEAMSWDEIPPCVNREAPLIGNLACTSIVVTPNADQLKHLERCIDVDYIEDFKACAVKEDGEVTDHVLSWAARISHADSILALGAISLALGRAPLLVKVSNASRAASKVGEKRGPSKGADDGADADENQLSLAFDGEAEEPGGQFVQAAEETTSEERNEVEITNENVGRIRAACEDFFAAESEPEAAPLATAREAAGGTHARGRRRDRKSTMNPIPSAPGDGEGGGESVEKCISDQGEGWIGNITVIERDGVLAWTVAVQIGDEVGEFESPMPPPVSSPRAVLAAVEKILEWVKPFKDSIRKEDRFGAAAMTNWALNTRANNSVSDPAESSIRVARGGAR